jgi:hypothetical protein
MAAALRRSRADFDEAIDVPWKRRLFPHDMGKSPQLSA